MAEYRRENHRADVGPADRYDILGASQFCLLFLLGLREKHRMLDIGCGSLRGGKFFIPYLRTQHYYGIEPRQSVVDDGIEFELLETIYERKEPQFLYSADFDLTAFGVQFDVILAQSVFSHASQQQIRTCLDEARRCLKRTGFMAVTYMPGLSDYEGERWLWERTADYRPKTIKRLVEEAGLRPRDIAWPHVCGQNWLYITHPGEDVRPPGYSPLRGLMGDGAGA